MKKITLLSPILLLAACAASGGPGPVDAQKFLSSLDGPKVPTIQDALLDSARNAEKQGDYKQAAALYQQALQKHPESKETALALADSYRRSGENDKALDLYNVILSKDSANLTAKEGKGLTLLAKGDFETPVALFQEVAKAEPNRWKTLNALGILFTTRGMQPEAQQYFQAALKNNHGSATITNNLGLSQALARQYDNAQATLAQAAVLAPADSLQRKRIELNMALVYASAGKLEEAKTIAERYYSGAALNNNLGLYAHLAKDDQMAKAYLNMALTESKVFYEKAWNNLQGIGGGAPITGEGKMPPENDKKDDKKAIGKAPPARDGLTSIINDPGDTAKPTQQ